MENELTIYFWEIKQHTTHTHSYRTPNQKYTIHYTQVYIISPYPDQTHTHLHSREKKKRELHRSTRSYTNKTKTHTITPTQHTTLMNNSLFSFNLLLISANTPSQAYTIPLNIIQFIVICNFFPFYLLLFVSSSYNMQFSSIDLNWNLTDFNNNNIQHQQQQHNRKRK